MSVVSAPSSATAAKQKSLIVFCHGSGDTGLGAQAWIESLVPPSVMQQWDWIFPSAEPIPYQLLDGAVASVWYDRVGGFDPSFPEQTASVERSTDRLIQLLDEQVSQQGREPRRMIIGGFSMGGAIAYQTAARWHARPESTPLGAVFGLSCYLNQDSKVWSILDGGDSSSDIWPPTFVAHGARDDFILPQWGESTYQRLHKLGIPASFRLVPDLHHDMAPGEIAELLQFLDKTVGLEGDVQARTSTGTKGGSEGL